MENKEKQDKIDHMYPPYPWVPREGLRVPDWNSKSPCEVLEKIQVWFRISESPSQELKLDSDVGIHVCLIAIHFPQLKTLFKKFLFSIFNFFFQMAHRQK